MSEVRLSNIVASSFWAVHRDIKRHDHTFYWLKGGRGSTKSSFVSIEIPLLLLKHELLFFLRYNDAASSSSKDDAGY